jgi:hypothetical protein
MKQLTAVTVALLWVTLLHAQTPEELSRARAIDSALTDCLTANPSMPQHEKEFWISKMPQIRDQGNLGDLREICFGKSRRDGRVNPGKIPEHLAGVKPGMLIHEVKYLSKNPVELSWQSSSKDPECSFEIWSIRYPDFDEFKVHVHQGYVYSIVAKKRTILNNLQVGQFARDVVSRYGNPEYLSCGFAGISTLDECRSGRFYMSVNYRNGERSSAEERGFDVSIWGDDYEAEMRFRGEKIQGEVPKGVVFILWKGAGYYEKLSNRCSG